MFINRNAYSIKRCLFAYACIPLYVSLWFFSFGCSRYQRLIQKHVVGTSRSDLRDRYRGVHRLCEYTGAER